MSWYATSAPPLSKFSAWIVPGSATGVPVYGVELTPVVSAVTRIQLKLPTAPPPLGAGVHHEPEHLGAGRQRNTGPR